MTPTTKKITITISVLALLGGIGFLIYKRKKNQKDGDELLAYIDTLPKINTTGAVVDQLDKLSASIINELNTTSSTALNGKGLVLDGKSYTLGKDNEKITPIVNSIVKGLYDSMEGSNITSNISKFMASFKRIGNKNAMIYINILYKALYKKTLWEAIKGELWLYTGNLKSATLNSVDLPNYHPSITTHLYTLK